MGYFVVIDCIIPILSAVLFTLSMDVSTAREHVARLAALRDEGVLTVQGYREAREAVRSICSPWTRSLRMLAGTAAVNSTCYVIYLFMDPSNWTNVEHDRSSFYSIMWFTMQVGESAEG